MNLDQPYNKEDFQDFLLDFLPEDYTETNKDMSDVSGCKVIRVAREIGRCHSLDLSVLEMQHEKETDPRIAIATDAFKLLATYGIDKALVIFNNNDSHNYRFSYLTVTLDIDEAGKIKKSYSNARRYSFLLGVGAKVKTPEQQLIKKGRVATVEDLLNRFSLEVVNKQFYLEVAKHFDELVKPEEHFLELPFQSDPNVRKNFAMRLVGRLMFCWFLKQKQSKHGQLIPNEILSAEAVKDNYYHNTLEPLFFEVLNTQIDARDIRNDFYDKVPYLNGGLFSPQIDDYYELDHSTYTSKHLNTLKISDRWFAEFFALLETYNFTIDENTAFDQELSVDPEMLGRIFENLLAEISPETGSSERKHTGSFYTPRQIVEYMVDQSLLEYLKTKTGIDEEKLHALITYDLDDDALYPRTEEENRKIIDAIETLKVLDPACGSGAFPIGMLQKIVWILQNVDPDCRLWLEKKLVNTPEMYKEKIISESKNFDYTRKKDVIKNSIFGVDIQPIAVEISRLRCFLTLVVESEIHDDKPNRGIEPLPNLDFKFVCANTLIPAPEQEVADGRLFGDDFQKNFATAIDKYFSSSGASKIVAINAVHKLIDAKVDEKLRHVQGLISYNGDEKMEAIRAQTNKAQIKQHARILTMWSSYKNIFENKPVDFFDPAYFFPSVKEGFDVVIGNPPYVSTEKVKGSLKDEYKDIYHDIHKSRIDIYAYFYKRAFDLLKPETGLLVYITSNKWMRAGYGEKLRGYFATKDPIVLIDFGGFKVFDSATVDTNILLIRNAEFSGTLHTCHMQNDFARGTAIGAYVAERGSSMQILTAGPWFIGSDAERSLKAKIESIGVPLKDWDVKINFGIKTGLNEAFIIDSETRAQLIAEDPKSEEIIKPILRGRDIKRYSYEFADLYVLLVGYGDYKKLPTKYPAIFNHLKQYEEKLKKRGQCKGSRSGKAVSSDFLGQHHWLELDNNPRPSYFAEFEKEKIVWKRIGSIIRFAYISEVIYGQDSTCVMTGNQIRLISAVLNSKLGHHMLQDSPRTGTGDLILSVQALTPIRIPKSTSDNNPLVDSIEKLVTKITEDKKQNKNTDQLEREIDQLVYQLYHLTPDEIAIIEKSAN